LVIALTALDVLAAALVAAIAELGIAPEEVRRVSALLRLMSGQYDQAARAATSL
jgi:predicted MarR family transcription regulator